jgi:DNA topoisomerase-1
MGKKLVIVESPAKAKTIGKILGPEYLVKASVGHIRDLPERKLGVDIEHGFAPEYVITKDKAKIVNELKKAVKSCDEIYLAPDPDREGEAIAWHLHETLAPTAKRKPFLRVQYNEITPRAVKAAFTHPGDIDMKRVDAQQARRVLDRIVGYMVSPMLWRTVKKGLSAGRVQSVALRLVCEREQEIKAFKPEEYWVFGAQVRRETEPLEPFEVRLVKVDGAKPAVPDEADAKALLSDLEGSSLRVADVKSREIARHAMPPFITSTLQQAASSFFGFSPNRTMGLAQKLYEGVELSGSQSQVGLITYMRTDSVNIARDAQDAAMAYITKTFGPEYYPEKPNVYRSRESAQEAHEAIRPTDVTRTPESLKCTLDPPSLKLYELIWKRFVASQMASARIAQKTVLVEPSKEGMAHKYTFSVSSSEAVFEGFLKVTALDIHKKRGEDDVNDDEPDDVDRLPPLAAGDPLALVKWLSERKETKPPARYSEASLIKALEANGVGRPSTYATIIETLNSRGYTTREKRQVLPTAQGLVVNDNLVSKLPQLFDVGFTAKMEGELDNVEGGSEQWTRMLAEFYSKFKVWMEHAKEPPADSAKVNMILQMLESVKNWNPAVKRGKRTFSDEKFAASVREQRDKGEKPVSDKQLNAIARLAVRYRAQIPDAEAKLSGAGFGEELARDMAAPTNEEAMRRFAVLKNVPMSESQNSFIESLRQQAESGRKLSEKQLSAIDRIIVQHKASIEGFDKIRQELNLSEVAADMPPDNESPILVQMLDQVKEWQPPVVRGKMTFDDQAFYKSVHTQYMQKNSLSPRQRYALKRMLFRYKAQIKDFDKFAEQLGLNKHAKAAKDAAPGDAPAPASDGTAPESPAPAAAK